MHVIGLTGEGLGLSPGATGIRREKTQFICKEEAPNRGGAKGDDAGQGRRETEEGREKETTLPASALIITQTFFSPLWLASLLISPAAGASIKFILTN